VNTDPIQIVRGDDTTIRLAVADDDGQPVDLTGWAAVLTAKKQAASAVPVIRVQGATGPDGAVIVLSHDATRVPAGRYAGDIQLTGPDGNIVTAWLARLTVVPDVTDPGDHTP
jgi:hypothetical protein